LYGADLEEYSGPDQLADEKLVFFMVATYGDGEPTDNAADFYGWLLKAGAEAERGGGDQFLKVINLIVHYVRDFTAHLLSCIGPSCIRNTNLVPAVQGVTFGIFGLGNKQYEHFCMVGKRMQKALISLGADPIVRRGDGDDDEDIEADFDSWRSELMTALDSSDGLLAIGEVCATWMSCMYLSVIIV
jgi:NADPH-ferrihemoprotein reductase